MTANAVAGITIGVALWNALLPTEDKIAGAIPTGLLVAVGIIALVVAQFTAFHKVRVRRDAFREKLGLGTLDEEIEGWYARANAIREDLERETPPAGRVHQLHDGRLAAARWAGGIYQRLLQIDHIYASHFNDANRVGESRDDIESS